MNSTSAVLKWVIVMVAVSSKIGVGVDPEVFVIDDVLKRYISGHDLIPGTKEEPHPVRNGAVQVDGVALEYNIKPAYTAKQFRKHNASLLHQLRKMIPKDKKIMIKPAIRFDEIFFDSLPHEPKILGCSPDFNAYTGKVNPKPSFRKGDETMRTGSGHIHVSWTSNENLEDPSFKWDCEYIVKCLESIVGPYIDLWDQDTERSRLYGKPGAFRYKHFGVEWRSPSNAWLNHPEIWEWIFEVCKFVVEKALKEDENIIRRARIRRFPQGIARHAVKMRRESLNESNKRSWKDFPEMPPLSFEKEYSEEVLKKVKPKVGGKVWMASTQTTTSADVDLDILAPDSFVSIEDDDDYEEYDDDF